MQKFAFVLIGRSGSGKGTQAQLLKDYLNSKGADTKHFTTGGEFREFVEKDNFVSKTAKASYEKGDLFPEFLAIYNWTNIFIKNVDENTSVILDGAPRRVDEAKLLNDAFSYLGYENLVPIYFDISRTGSKNRLLSRGRSDDVEKNIEARLDWFDLEVLPVVDFYKEKYGESFIHLDAEKSVEEIFEELKSKINFE
jgi:adenylate kinase